MIDVYDDVYDDMYVNQNRVVDKCVFLFFLQLVEKKKREREREREDGTKIESIKNR